MTAENATRENEPTSKYGDVVVHRMHNRYTPAEAPILELMTSATDVAVPECCDESRPVRAVGFSALGKVQEVAIMNDAGSACTAVGMEAPTIDTV